MNYQVDQNEVEVEIIDNQSGAYRIISHTIREERIETELYGPHTFLWKIEETDGKITSACNVHTLVGTDFDGWSRHEMEAFISALINFVEIQMFTVIHTPEDMKEFVHDYTQNTTMRLKLTSCTNSMRA